ncbi:MAG: GWxTD domain-containing protein [Cyclobacteriaceae bacterium]|nr:GWxTD domain-containing protein [Cyclobacteriaceae bacterium]
MIRLYTVFTLLFIAITGFSQGINYSHQYNPNALFQLEHKVVYNNNSTDILLKIISKDSINNYKGILDFRSSYLDNSTDSSANIYLDKAIFNKVDNTWLLDLSFKKMEKKRLLLLQFTHNNTGMSYYFDIPLYWHPKINQSSTLLYDTNMQVPVFENYLSTNTYYKTDQSEYIHYYNSFYSAATPPMSSTQLSTDPQLSIDTTFLIFANEKFALSKEGMYFFENDSSNLHGSVFYVLNKPYPYYTSIKELIEPTRYITTSSEFKRLKSSPNKESFEKVWLDITGDPDRAKQIIRNYYRRVAYANQLFTTFKEGWKTDMGMIYIMFGAPTEVYKYGNKEEWIYAGTKQQSKLKFTFVKVDNVFSEKLYRLVRKKEYSMPWMNKVDLWRKGRIK